jgi:hypothetical protein
MACSKETHKEGDWTTLLYRSSCHPGLLTYSQVHYVDQRMLPHWQAVVLKVVEKEFRWPITTGPLEACLKATRFAPARNSLSELLFGALMGHARILWALNAQELDETLPQIAQ